MSDTQEQILKELSNVREILAEVLAHVKPVAPGEVPPGFDEQEVGAYVISQTKKEGNNGKTNPVMYLYLTAPDAPLPTLTVYGSDSHLLPAFLRKRVDWQNGQYKRVVEKEKPDVIASGDYVEIPPFKVWRKHGPIQENGHAKKDLYKVSWMSDDAKLLEDMANKSSEAPAEEPEESEVVANGEMEKETVLDWAVQYGMFSGIDAAAEAYEKSAKDAEKRGGSMPEVFRHLVMAKLAVSLGVYKFDDAMNNSERHLGEENGDVKWKAHVLSTWATKDGAFATIDEAMNAYRWAYSKGLRSAADWQSLVAIASEYYKVDDQKPMAEIFETLKDFWCMMNPGSLDEFAKSWSSKIASELQKKKAK